MSIVSISIVWGLFSLAFFLLAFHHRQLSKKVIPNFQSPELHYWEPKPPAIPVNTGISSKDIKMAFEKFGSEVNSYIENYNKSSREQNKAQELGYIIAGFTGLFSFVITILPIIL